MARSRQGLLDAFAQARPRLEAMARARTGSREAAEDLMQDAWLKLSGGTPRATVDNPVGFAIARELGISEEAVY